MKNNQSSYVDTLKAQHRLELAAAVQAEREACARLIEGRCCGDPGCRVSPLVCSQKAAANAIRARGPTDALASALARAGAKGMERAAALFHNVSSMLSRGEIIARIEASAEGEGG